MKVPLSFDAAANTEKAKKLLKTGAIQVTAEKKTTFKRSTNLTRRLLVSSEADLLIKVWKIIKLYIITMILDMLIADDFKPSQLTVAN